MAGDSAADPTNWAGYKLTPAATERRVKRVMDMWETQSRGLMRGLAEDIKYIKSFNKEKAATIQEWVNKNCELHDYVRQVDKRTFRDYIGSLDKWNRAHPGKRRTELMDPELVKERERLLAESADDEMLEPSDEPEPPTPVKGRRGPASRKKTAVKQSTRPEPLSPAIEVHEMSSSPPELQARYADNQVQHQYNTRSPGLAEPSNLTDDWASVVAAPDADPAKTMRVVLAKLEEIAREAKTNVGTWTAVHEAASDFMTTVLEMKRQQAREDAQFLLGQQNRFQHRKQTGTRSSYDTGEAMLPPSSQQTAAASSSPFQPINAPASFSSSRTMQTSVQAKTKPRQTTVNNAEASPVTKKRKIDEGGKAQSGKEMSRAAREKQKAQREMQEEVMAAAERMVALQQQQVPQPTHAWQHQLQPPLQQPFQLAGQQPLQRYTQTMSQYPQQPLTPQMHYTVPQQAGQPLTPMHYGTTHPSQTMSHQAVQQSFQEAPRSREYHYPADSPVQQQFQVTPSPVVHSASGVRTSAKPPAQEHRHVDTRQRLPPGAIDNPIKPPPDEYVIEEEEYQQFDEEED